MMRRTTLTLAVVALLAFSMAHAQDADTGSADFSTFVAVGDSLVAGESNSSLTEVFQQSAPPLLLYQQIFGSDDFDFEMPWYSDPGDQGRLVIGPGGTPVRIPFEGVPLNDDLDGPYHNMGLVGGARALDLLVIGDDSSCGSIPYHDEDSCERLMITLRQSGTAVDQVQLLQPTFVFLWIGGNDALQAAASGVMQLLTPAETWDNQYRSIVAALGMGSELDMAVATVPNVTSIPLLTTLPPILLNYQTQEPVIVNGNFVPLIGPGDVFTAAGDLVSLPALEWLLQGCGVIPGLEDEAGITRNTSVCPDGAPLPLYVLKAADAVTVQNTIDAYNDTIRDVAQENGYAFFDAAAFLDDLAANGYPLGGIEYSTEFLTGGLFSYDGFHPAPIAMALSTNEIIKSINAAYGARIPPVNLNGFVFGPEGNLSPPLQTPTELTISMGRMAREAMDLPTVYEAVEAGYIEAPDGVRRIDTGDRTRSDGMVDTLPGKRPTRFDGGSDRQRRR